MEYAKPACPKFCVPIFSRAHLDMYFAAKINFREYKLSRMGPFKNSAGINFRDRGKFRPNFLIFIITAIDQNVENWKGPHY